MRKPWVHLLDQIQSISPSSTGLSEPGGSSPGSGPTFFATVFVIVRPPDRLYCITILAKLGQKSPDFAFSSGLTAMPIYEYEPIGFPCPICENRFEVIQSIDDPPLEHCPTCGLKCRKLVSRAAFKLTRPSGADQAAKKGLSTFRKAGKGTWEKVAGPGVDIIQGTPEQIAQVESEKAQPARKKPIDLDKQ